MIPETTRLRYTPAYRLFSALAVVCLLLTALMIVDVILSPLQAQAYSGSVVSRLLNGLLLAPLTAVIGVLCVRYAPGNVVGLLLIFMAAGASLLSVRAAFDPLVVVLGGDIGAILFWACYLLLFLYFPNGQPYFRRAGALVAWVTLLLFCGAAVGQILTAPTLRFGAYGADNSIASPFYIPGLKDAYALFIQVAGSIVSIFFLLFALLSFILRYRAAGPGERQQIKWLLWAFCIWLAPQMAVGLLPGLPIAVTQAVAAYGQGAAAFVAPLGIGAAILLNKLWDIDIIIRRTLIYAVLTALLAGVYFGGVVLLQLLLRPLTGAGNDLAVVASTLLIAALFLPLRQRVQGFIDRRFYRRKYDAAKTLAAFGAHVRDEVELDRLTGRLVEIVDETMQPAHVSLWLREPPRKAGESRWQLDWAFAMRPDSILSAQREANMATFVLVHGAWHGGWCWQKVIPFLEAAGHAVYAPSLTGMGERASELSPDVGLDTHIQDIAGLLEDKDLRGVILVGHSYGGMVITGVVDRVPERIARLVYLDTFVPRDGESMVDVSPLVIRLLLRKQAHGDGWRVESQGTYGVTTEPDRSWVLSQVTPQPRKTLEQPLHLKNPAIVSATPRTHIECTSGGFFFAFMRWLLARRALPPREAGWRLRQLPTGHDAMITMPRELAELLLEGAER